VFGRRRIGKSELLMKFCSDKKTLFFNCIQGSESDNLHYMTAVLSKYDGVEREDHTFMTDLLEDVAELCRKEKLVIVFDNSFPIHTTILE
jgi:uncharacterized protein